MTVIGITGGIGSGKSAATDYLATRGVKIVDADLCARLVVEPGEPALEQIFEHFGQSLRLQDGHLDRRQLREIIFNDADEKTWLESLLHPIIRNEIFRQISSDDHDVVVLVSPLLFETDQHTFCDQTWLIAASRALQVERTVARDQSSKELVEHIIDTQMPTDEKRNKADRVIENHGTLDELHAQLDQALKKILKDD
jgi:dephospho-CoA kinase